MIAAWKWCRHLFRRRIDPFDLFFHSRRMEDHRPPSSGLPVCATCRAVFIATRAHQSLCERCIDRHEGVGSPACLTWLLYMTFETVLVHHKLLSITTVQQEAESTPCARKSTALGRQGKTINFHRPPSSRHPLS